MEAVFIKRDTLFKTVHLAKGTALISKDENSKRLHGTGHGTVLKR